MLSRLLAFFTDWFWAFTAAILIAGAAAVTIVRLLLPGLDSHGDELAGWIADTIGRPAVVDRIEASWSGWTPRISVTGLALYDASRTTELMRFEAATINIDLLESVLAGALKPRNLILSGVALTLVRDADGRFSVAGMPPPKSPILRWLVEQDNFAVTRADLTIIDAVTDQTFALSDLNVAIRNRGEQRHLSGFVDLPPAIGKRLVMDFAARGDPLGAAWSGTLDFSLQEIAGDYVLDQLGWHGPRPASGAINVLGWSAWEDARMQHVRLAVDAADGDATRLRANARLQRRAQGWLLQIAELVLDGARSAPPARVSVAWDRDPDGVSRVATRGFDVPLELVNTLATGLAPLSENLRRNAAGLAPSGNAAEFSGAWQRAGPEQDRPMFAGDAKLVNVALAEHAGLPALSGLEAGVTIRRDGSRATFKNAAFRLNDDERLVETLSVSGLHGKLSWRPAGAAGGITAEALRGEINGTHFLINGGVRQPAQGTALADIRVELPLVDGPRLHHLVPLKRLPPRGEAWTRSVIESGVIRNGVVVLRGPLAKFPFRANEGVFAARFEVDDGTLRYSGRWPEARDVRGVVTIDGVRVGMQVAHAEVLGASIEQAEITMADLFVRERYVDVTGMAHGPATSATAIIMASPLRNGRAARVAELDIDGSIEVKLDMHIGLYPGGTREVLGQTLFDGNRIDAPREKITLNDFTGTVSFTRGDWYGEGLSASFNGVPVGLVINGGLDDPNYDSEFRMTGVAPAASVVAEFKRYAPAVYRWLERYQALEAIGGTLPWKSVLTIPTRTANGPAAPRRLRLESSLQGLDLALPWPLGKNADEQRPVSVEFAISEGVARTVRIDYADILNAEIRNGRGADGRPALTSAEILLGLAEAQFGATEGITFRGYLPRLDAGEWLRFLRRAPAAQALPAAAEPGLSWDLRFGELQFLGNRFSDVRVHGERAASAWQAQLASARVSGAISVPRDRDNGTLTLDFDHLLLDPLADNGEARPATQYDPRVIPDVDFNAGRLQFGAIALGSAAIRTRQVADGLSLEQLRFADDDFEIEAEGEWVVQNDAQSSRFNINLTGASLAGILDRFGYSVANIKDGATDMRINATWPGTPVEFSLARMTGNFELHVTDGSLLDVEPGSGRLFGLLSIQTLPRRLLFDFDDLFRKGFVFDSIDGVFVLENGNAYTNSLLMRGPSARVNISGRTGLAEQDYDQNVVVTPALSTSIPVAGALFGPIGVGAGAVYYLGQKMFKSIPEQIDKFLSRKYSVTGPWEDPTIERL